VVSKRRSVQWTAPAPDPAGAVRPMGSCPTLNDAEINCDRKHQRASAQAPLALRLLSDGVLAMPEEYDLIEDAELPVNREIPCGAAYLVRR
jgi:hypothetical protein